MSTMTMFDLAGKTGVVTGAASGIGKASAEALAQAGANVVIADLDLHRAESVADSITAAGNGRAVAVRCDVTDEGSVAAMIAAAGRHFSPIDVLVNSAGITDSQSVRIHEQTTDAWNTVMSVNLQGVFLASREALMVMSKRDSGRIINIASVWGLTGSSGVIPAPAYTASKGAVVNFTREAALEYATQGITVNAICPGFFRTNIGDGMFEDAATYQALANVLPMKRVAEPDEIKGLIIYLASDSSSFMTGSIIPLDGGHMAG